MNGDWAGFLVWILLSAIGVAVIIGAILYERKEGDNRNESE